MSMSEDGDVRRLVYASVPTGRAQVSDLDAILTQARRNNGMNGISGLLLTATDRYVQVLEGTPEAIDFIMEAIRQDKRHTDIQVLDDTRDSQRTFGAWSMANLPGGSDEPAVRRRLKQMLRNASDPVRRAFGLLD